MEERVGADAVRVSGYGHVGKSVCQLDPLSEILSLYDATLQVTPTFT